MKINISKEISYDLRKVNIMSTSRVIPTVLIKPLLMLLWQFFLMYIVFIASKLQSLKINLVLKTPKIGSQEPAPELGLKKEFKTLLLFRYFLSINDNNKYVL